MEKEIKKTTAHVKVAFACFWMISILLVISGEMGSSWVGLYVGNISATYMAETITILLTASCVPISLKLFSWVLTRKIDIAALPKALRLYALWSDIRLVLLSLPVLTGFFTYYMMLSTTGVLCAMIGLTASLFCLPGEERLRKELHIDK
ncbi:hypothetical protein [Bacteroides heparinolyticus]|uniref:Putative transmembrane protein n=2 Tax=Prevotella heparinolytica TaxID=28113 RepID=A0A3P2A1W3_9BACE|nr:hypothetical protein [Bacteroides heparinolyticus]MCI6213685.1 hypothetical protein [Bacteroides heparinolyticus]RRD89414.1 hypothetical protein EII33_10045 [Bacteroides heparinolyticus]VFB15204.1 putative transmembrane protein [Bacteroides heparinolyticus]